MEILRKIGYFLLTLIAIASNVMPFLLAKLFYNFMDPINFWQRVMFLLIIIIPFLMLQVGAFAWAGVNIESRVKEWKTEKKEVMDK